MTGSKFIAPLILSASALGTGANAATTTPPVLDDQDVKIEFSARDSLTISTPELMPMTVGIGSKGIELFIAKKTAEGLKIDTGLLSINSPPGELAIGSRIRDLHAQGQAYSSNFIGTSVEKSLSATTSMMAYGGKDIAGGYAAGARYMVDLSPNSKIILDAYKDNRLSSVGGYVDWHRDGDSISQSARAGVSLRNGNPTVSGVYSAEKKFALGDNGYLRGQFTTSASKDRSGSKLSVSAVAMKDVYSFSALGVPATVEMGVGLQKVTGEAVKPIAVWNIKIP